MSEQLSQDSTLSHMQPDQPTEHSGKSSWAVEVIPVAPEEMQPYWHVLEPLMIRIVESTDGRQTMASMLQKIMQGETQAWAVVINREIKALVGTEIVNYPTGLRTCAFRFVGGSGVKKWCDEVVAVVEEYAAANGCDRVEVYARKAWARLMPSYKIDHIHLEKEL